MKFLVVLSIVVACVAADVSHLDSQAPIVRSDFEITPEGAFQYAYETGNGISAQAQGAFKNTGNEYPSLAIQGAYKYTAPDGTPVETSYVADEEGYKAVGNAIPTPHPIPELIARSLAYIAAHPPQEVPYAAAKAVAKPAYG